MRKRILALLLALVIAVGLLPTAAWATENTAVSSIQIGDYVQVGKYNGYPIPWRCVAFEKVTGTDANGNPIIDSTDTKTEYEDGYLPLMLADIAICSKGFDHRGNVTTGSHGRHGDRYSGGSNYWGDSNIRDWLNSSADSVTWSCGNSPSYANEKGFLTNFNNAEKAAIKTVTQKSLLAELDKDISGATGSAAHTYGYEITDCIKNYADAYSEQITDGMFLLDVQQLKNVYVNLGDYYKLSSDYWLRSPEGEGHSYARDVTASGIVGRDTAYTSEAVRPAFFLDPAATLDGAGTQVAPYTLAAPAHSHAVSVDCSTTEGTQVEFTAWDGRDMSENNGQYGVYLNPGSYCLTDDVTINNPLKINSGTVDLCLNGHTINIGGIVQVLGTLNICDCSQAHSGKIKNTGNTNAVVADASGSKVNLYGGTVEGKYGLSANSTGAEVAIYGGTVKGSEYALRANDENAVITLYGSPTLEGETADIFLNYATLHIGDTLAQPSAAYTVEPYSYTSPARFTSGWSTHMSQVTDLSKYIVSANSRYDVAVDGSTGELKFSQAQPAHTHAVSVGCETDSGDQVEFTEWKSGNFNSIFPSAPGNYALAEDVTIRTETWTISSGVVNLCLNGHTLNMTNGGKILLNGSDAKLNICDCSEHGSGSIKSVSSSLHAEAISITGSNSTLNLYGGNIHAEFTNASGVYAYGVDAGSAFINIYGGQITAKSSSTKAVALNISSNTPKVKIYGGILTANAPEGQGEYGLYLPSLYSGWSSYSIEGGVYIGRNSIGIGSNTIPIKVTGGIFSTDPTGTIDPSYTARKINSSDPGYQAKYDGYYVVQPASGPAPAHSHDGITFTPWNGTDDVTYTDSTASVYLTKDVTRSDVGFSVPAGKSLHLCLNGFTVSGNIATGLFSVDKGGALTVCDCSESSTGKIHSGDGFGCVGVYNQGAFILKSGTVEGTAVGVYNGGNNYDCTINGGVVTGRSGVYNQGFGAYAKTFIKGGTITGSTEYGVHNYAAGTELYLSGAPSITGAKADIYTEADSSYIHADDSALPATPYSGKVLSLGYPSPLTPGNAVVRHATEATEDKFKLADQGYGLALDKTNRTLIITKPQVVTPHTCTGMGESVTFDKALTADTLNITESGNYYLPASLNLGDSGVTIGEGVSVKLCLNGYDLNYSKNRGEAIKVEKGGTLELCDCTGYGHITATDSESAIFLSGAALIQHSGVVSAKKGNGITMSYDDGGDEDDPAQWIASTATIKGGSVLGDAAGINAAGGSLTVTGGDIEAKGSNLESGQPVAALYCMAMDALTVSGGQFEGVYGLYLISYGDNDTQLSGGQFYSKAGGHPIYIPDGVVIGEPLTYADLLVNGYAYKDINSGAILTGKEAIEAATAIKVEQGGSTPTPSHTHAWATAWEKNETHHWHECVGAGTCDITSNSGKNGYGEHIKTWINTDAAQHWQTCGTCGWTGEKVSHVYSDSADTTCNICGYEREIQTYEISGTVTDNGDTAVSGVTVKLMRGNTPIASTTTDASGNYSFTEVAPGLYNVVATKDSITKTILVEITNQNADNQNIKMPDGNKNSVVEVTGSGTPDVVVGGVDAIAEAETVNSGETVTVKLTVEKKDNPTDKTDIDNVAQGKTVELYLDLSLVKTVQPSSGSSTDTTITDTRDKVLAVVVPYDFTNKTNVMVYRSHDGSAAALTALTSIPTTPTDGTFYADSANGRITIYATKFSTYAIGYTAAVTKYTLTVNGGTGSGSYAAGITVSISATIPSGKRFTGWTGATVANASNVSTTLTMPAQNTTVTANFQNISNGGGGGGSYSPTIYPVNVPDNIPDGTVSVSPKSASSGTTVTITVTPDEGYEIGKVTVTDKDGKEITVTDKGNGKYTFTMPAGKVTISASFTKIRGSYADCPKDNTCPIWPYTDASVTAWYHDGVHYCIENGLMLGYGNYIFGPDNDTSRAMIATILWKLEGSPVVNYILPFDDVAEGTWYTEAIRWAAASGIVSGYGNGLFGPNDNITREQLVTMFYHYEQYKGGGFTDAWMFPLDYTDAELVSSWAYEPMCWTTMNGIVEGIGNGLLDPKGKATRAQAATMIMRFCEKK